MTPIPEKSSDRDPALIHCDLALARRLERAEGRSNAEFVEARSKAFPEIGGCWLQVAGAYAMFDGADSPCTQTFGLGVFDPVTDGDMTALERFFQERGADTFHEISALAEPSLLGLLTARGYRPIELSSVVFRPIQAGASQTQAGRGEISVREIKPDEHERWARVASAGWEDAAPGMEDFLVSLGKVNPHRANTHCFFAERQGEPIATGAICLFDSVAVLAGASTIPHARGQGAQLALLGERLRFAAQRGCDIAMMAALPGSASQRNAERQGFRVAYTRTKWQRAREA